LFSHACAVQVTRLSNYSKRRKIVSFWTEDGRIYVKINPDSSKKRVESDDDIDKLIIHS